MAQARLFSQLIRPIIPLLLLSWLAQSAHAAESWIIGRSDHFEMYSSTDETESRDILVALEQFRTNFLGLFPLRGASEPRTTIVVFASDSAFRPYKPLYKGKPKEVAGYFLSHPDEVTIAMSVESHDEDSDARQVIYHEYVHLMLHARDSKYPLWLDEGLAETFSTFKVVDGKAEYGAVRVPHVALLQNVTLLPLPKLFAVTHESPEYNEEDRVGLFYAEAWAFTHFLLFGEDKSNAEKLGNFARSLAKGADVAPSFRQAFGTDFMPQELALRAYVDSGGYFKRGRPVAGQTVRTSFRPASDVERDTALLNLRWRIHHGADAAAGALALLERDPTKPRPHELLAAIAANNGDVVTAQEHWRRAAELGSDNAWVYIQLLQEALASYRGASVIDTRLSAENVDPWRRWAQRATELSPENTDAVEAALWVEALAEKMDVRVINRVQRLTATMRDHARTLLGLAIIHWRANNPASARTILTMVESLPRVDMTTRSTATALRYRLPEDPSPASAGASADPGTGRAGIALQSSRVGAAAAFLDAVLAQQGTTASRLELDPVVARPVDGNEPNPWTISEQFRKDAAAGDANAMFELAVAHACGAGAEFSPSLATGWLQKAADHGHALSKAGFAPGAIDPELVAQYLRNQRPPAKDPLPPLEKELASRIAEATAMPTRHQPIVLYQAAPRFPEELRRAGGGEALVHFRIRADGHPDLVRAIQFSDAAAGTAAEECIRGWRFIPMVRDGKPTGTLVQVKVTFQTSPAAAAKRS